MSNGITDLSAARRRANGKVTSEVAERLSTSTLERVAELLEAEGK